MRGEFFYMDALQDEVARACGFIDGTESAEFLGKVGKWVKEQVRGVKQTIIRKTGIGSGRQRLSTLIASTEEYCSSCDPSALKKALSRYYSLKDSEAYKMNSDLRKETEATYQKLQECRKKCEAKQKDEDDTGKDEDKSVAKAEIKPSVKTETKGEAKEPSKVIEAKREALKESEKEDKEEENKEKTTEQKKISTWVWIAIGIVIVGIIAFIMFRRKN